MTQQRPLTLRRRIRQELREHLPHVLVVLLIYTMVYAGTASLYQGWDLLLTQDSDHLVHIPRALKLNQPELYSRDPAFGSFNLRDMEILHQALFPWLLSCLLPLLGIKGSLIGLSLVLGITFVIGTYTLSWALTRDHLASVVAAALGCFVYEGLSAVTLGFNPPQVLPRNLVVACSPWIFALFLRWRLTWRLPLVFAWIGLCANLHATAALHLCGLLSLTFVLSSKPSLHHAKRLLAAGTAALVGALPALLTLISKGNTSALAGAATEQAVAHVETQLSFAIVPSGFRLLLFGVPAAAFVLAGALGFRRLLRSDRNGLALTRPYLALYLIVNLVPWLGVLLNVVTLRFWRFEPLRVSRYVFALSFAPVGALLSDWIRSSRRWTKLQAAACLLILLIISRPEAWYVWWITTQHSETGSQTTLSLDGIEDVGAWAQSHTPVDALFLAPVNWALFSVVGQRSLVTAAKTSWAAPERYLEVKALYEDFSGASLAAAAARYEADFVVSTLGVALPGWRMAYANDVYAVYSIE